MNHIARVCIFGAFCATLPLHAAQASAAQLETVASFDAKKGQLPESITTDGEGNLYFSLAAASTVAKRSPSGDISVLGVLPIAVNALGVKVGPDGCVYTVSTSLTPTPGAFVWRICSPGVVEQIAALDQTGGPNDLAFDDHGNVYVTDTFLGRIWRVDPRGVVTDWLDSPLFQGNPANPALVVHAFGINGIAFDKHKKNLYVGNLDFGEILRIDFDHGRPGPVSVFASDPMLRGADGIAFDDRGNLVVAVNAQDQVASVDEDGRVTLLFQGGPLDSPSSVVFAKSGCGDNTLFVTSSAFLRAFGIQPGTPLPAILAADVRRGGLPLP